MELKDTVSLFSTEVFSDAFAPEIIFVGKINPFAEVANSGASAQRRILETPVSESIPLGRVIIAPSTQKFIVAARSIDFWNGESIRHKYPILPVSDMGTAGNIGEILAGSPPDPYVYAYPYFVRRVTDEEEMSDYFSGYELYFSQVKSFTRGDIIQIASDVYRLKTDTSIDGAGFSMAQAIRLENPLQTFNIAVQGNYDEDLDAFNPTTVAGVVCFVEPLKQDYEFVTPSFQSIMEGDKAISVLKSSATLSVNDMIGDFKVLSIRDFEDYVICHGRLMGSQGLPTQTVFLVDELDGAQLVEDSDPTIFFIDN